MLYTPKGRSAAIIPPPAAGGVVWYDYGSRRYDGGIMTDAQIQDLIACPKRITRRQPARGYRPDNRQQRCDLDLQSDNGIGGIFKVFIRWSTEFTENFSIGLRYQGNASPGEITLARYNGPHGETSRTPDGHYALPHIHRITAHELAAGAMQPQEKDREITNRYATFEQALAIFFGDAGVTNYAGYFPELQQGRLFDEH